MKTGIELIAAERERQITSEGWTPGHDKRACQQVNDMEHDNSKWLCLRCQLEFDEDDLASIDIAPDCDERMFACPECFANFLDDPDVLIPPTEIK